MTTDTAPKRVGNRRGSGAQLREEILAAAERLLATVGSRDAVTLRAIAREAGIAAPSIYPHFADRDAILDAVVARTFLALGQACRRAAEAEPEGGARVAAIGRAYLAFARRHPGQYRILFGRSPANIAVPPHQYPEGIEAFGILSRALEDAAAAGATGDVDPTVDGQSLFAALHGIATLPPALPAFPWRDDAELLANVLDKMVGRRVSG